MRAINWWLGVSGAVWLCVALAIGSVALAFMGATPSGIYMAKLPMLVVTALLALILAVVGVRAIRRKRYCSMLLHLGCVAVMSGWLMGRIAERRATYHNPSGGYMALADGMSSKRLNDGEKYIGELPFTVRLMRFTIDRYPASREDRQAGRLPPVKEYCSLVLIEEPGKKPYSRRIRVNHPARVAGFFIYQNSFREVYDEYNRPILITTLQFVRDPGLTFVFTGFALIILGMTIFVVRIARLNTTQKNQT